MDITACLSSMQYDKQIQAAKVDGPPGLRLQRCIDFDKYN